MCLSLLLALSLSLCTGSWGLQTQGHLISVPCNGHGLALHLAISLGLYQGLSSLLPCANYVGQQGSTSILQMYLGTKNILSIDDQERRGPRLMTRDPSFYLNNSYLGQEELEYVQGGRTGDIAGGYPGGVRRQGEISINIGIWECREHHNGL